MERNFISCSPVSLPLSTLIVEDNEDESDELVRLLSQHAGLIKVSFVASTLQEAKEQLIQPEGFDLSILDYELDYSKSMLDLIDMIPDKSRFGILVFTTKRNRDIDVYKLHNAKFSLSLAKPIDEDLVAEFAANLRQFIKSELGQSCIYYLKESTSGKRFRLKNDDILFIKAQDNYCEVYNSFGSIWRVREKLGVFAEELDEKVFMQTHRSFIVNTSKVKAFTGDTDSISNALFFHTDSDQPYAEFSDSYKDLLVKRGLIVAGSRKSS